VAPISQVHVVYRLARERKRQAVIHRCMPLTEATVAHRSVEGRSVFGRIVLTVELLSVADPRCLHDIRGWLGACPQISTPRQAMLSYLESAADATRDAIGNARFR
jgi:hypothetical protein